MFRKTLMHVGVDQRSTLFSVLFFIVLAGFLFLPTSTHRVLFYFFLVVGLFHVDFKKHFLYLTKNHAKFIGFIAAFLLYNFLSIFWSSGYDFEAVFSGIKIPVFISVFLFVTSYFIRHNTDEVEKIERYFCLTTLFFLIFYLALYIYQHSYGYSDIGSRFRLSGFGRSENPNDLGKIFSIAALLIFFRFQKNSPDNIFRSSYLRISLCLLLFVGVVLCGARGALLSFLITMFVVASFSLNKKTIFLSFFLLSLFSLYFLLNASIIENFIERKDSFRLLLWEESWGAIIAKPIFGHGILSELSMQVVNTTLVSHHNLLIGAMYYGGGIGLVLLVAMCVAALLEAACKALKTRDFFILSLLFYAAILFQTTGHTLYLNLNMEWLLFWIPCAYLLAGREGDHFEK